MRVLVTGSAGHLGEALVRTLREGLHEVIGLDLLASPFTTHVGSIADLDCVRRCMRGVDLVLHTAALHKPHVATHSRQTFVDTNITGTLNVLEAALANGVSGVVYTSTTSVFGAALSPADGQPAAWITEDVEPVAKNIYGVTKAAAEALCELYQRSKGLPSIVLRTSRFFPDADDRPELRQRYEDLSERHHDITLIKTGLKAGNSVGDRCIYIGNNEIVPSRGSQCFGYTTELGLGGGYIDGICDVHIIP